MPLFDKLGFFGHPFAKTNADEEPDLFRYFIPPPYFDAVVGDPDIPSASVVLAPRGAGKTALRCMVEVEASKFDVLAITYDRFEFSATDKVSEIGLQYHLRNIITRILIAYLTYLSENQAATKALSKEEKKRLGAFVSTYLGELTNENLQELLSELRSIPEKLKKFWSENVGFMDSVVNFVLKNYDLEGIDLPTVKQEEKKLSETYKHQLELLLNFVRSVGFKSIYILIDRVDETEQTGNDAEATYQLIKPIIRDLDLLGLPGYGFKFFLWDKIEPYYKKDARPDRVSQYTLNWTREGLKQVLSKRTKAFSSGTISGLNELLSKPARVDIDNVIAVLSNSSPRNLIRFCELTLARQAERDPESKNIELRSFDFATTSFAEIVVGEIYGDVIAKDLQKVGRELFTTNYIANDVFKISSQGARNKITSWMNTGIVQMVGTVTVDGSKKPVNFYCVIEPAAVRLIHRPIDIETFIMDRWLPCDHCDTDNLLDIELYPGDNDAVCRRCGRKLV